jgi:hypothetical protein
MDEHREFPLADVLSITTPYLLSRRRMDGVCELVDWMTFSAPTPDQIDLRAWSGLKLRTNLARKSLLRQYPHLEGLRPRTEADEADLISWLIEQERVHGPQLTVERAEVEMRDAFEAVAKAMAPIQVLMKELATKVGEAARTFGPLLGELVKFDAEMREAEAALPQHPDLAELDVRLKGFYGDPGAAD